MNTKQFHPTYIARAAMMLLLVVFTSTRVWATDYVTDVMLIGAGKSINTLKSKYQDEGWTLIDQDLNKGAGGAYVFLLYKKGTDKSQAITDFYIKVTDSPDHPETMTYNNRTYYLTPGGGNDDFNNGGRDLNRSAGGKFIYLYYTKDSFDDDRAALDIYVDDAKSGALGQNGDNTTGFDLNSGAGGDYIYLHVTYPMPTEYTYVERTWNDVSKKVEETTMTCHDPIPLTTNRTNFSTELTSGWYVVNISMEYKKPLCIIGNVNIILRDDCTLNALGGIYIEQDKTLTVYGQSGETGMIYAHSNSGPGIGGKSNTLAGHLIVKSGTIDAYAGSDNNAGIGGGSGGDSGIQSVTIYGGNVRAEGNSSGAGIGKGKGNNNTEVVTIYGGTVYADGGGDAAGIGGSKGRGNGPVTIYGGNVTALGSSGGAGIGGGEKANQDNPIIIHDGIVIAKNGSRNTDGTGAGIGGGNGRSGGTVIINGGTVTAEGGGWSAGIGGGTDGHGGDVTINDGEVTAECDTYPYRGAGIGGGEDGKGGTLTINGGIVNATSTKGAGIGGGYCASGGTVTITNGLVTASSKCGAGIGGGAGHGGGGGGNGGTVNISGGVVMATSTQKGAGIGGGDDGNGGTVNISGGHVTAVGGDYDYDYWKSNLKPHYTSFIKGWGGRDYHSSVISFIAELIFSGSYGGAGIGGGDDGNGGNVTITGGTVIASASNADAIGRGDGGKGFGSLTIYPEAKVTVIKKEQATVKETDKRTSCQRDTHAIIEPCEHAQVTYCLNGDDTHTVTCMNCEYTATNSHTIDDNGQCICGYGLGTSTIIVYQASPDGNGTYQEGVTYTVANSKAFRLPKCSTSFDGLLFEGWQEGTPSMVSGYEVSGGEDLRSENSAFVVTKDMSFVARYKRYWNGTGTGTATDPFIIATKADLDQLATRTNDGESFNGKYFQQTADISYEHTSDWNNTSSDENNFTPIGSAGKPFSGYYDGSGCTISGIRVKANHHAGLFGSVSGATIRNVILADTRIIASDRTGGIVGYKANGSTVEYCHVKADVCIHTNVNGTEGHGGIVGFNDSGDITACSSEATLSIADGIYCSKFGGIAGLFGGGVITNCLALNVHLPKASFIRVQNGYTSLGAVVGYNNANNENPYVGNLYHGCTMGGTPTATGIGCHSQDLAGAAPAYTVSSGTEGLLIVLDDEDGGLATYYNAGMIYDGRLYAKSGSVLPLELRTTGEYSFDEICTSSGSITANEGEEGYTLIIGPADAVITALIDQSLSLNDASDNTAMLMQHIDKVVDVTLADRIFYKDGSWNTVCLPFTVTAEKMSETTHPFYGATIMELDNSEIGSYFATEGENQGTLTLKFNMVYDGLTYMDDILPGKPYIIKWAMADPNNLEAVEGDLQSPMFNGVTIDNIAPTAITSTDDMVTFTGTYAPVIIGSEGDNTKLYLGANNTLYWPNAVMTIGCQRAFFQLNRGLIAGDPANGINAFVLIFGEDPEATGIVDALVDADLKSASQESGISNPLQQGDFWFTLDGLRLSGKPATKGIYIHNGHKVVIK